MWYSDTSPSPTVSSRDTILFLVGRGDAGPGDGISSPLVRIMGLDVGACLTSWILLLLRRLRDDFTSSFEESVRESPTCILDLTYRLGTWKKVATGAAGGVDDGRTIGGSIRLASIFDLIEELVDIMEAFENCVHCPMVEERYVGRTIRNSQLL
jgi:hypothetical protein